MCNCKGNCDTGYCACVKINKLCNENCNCPPTCNNILNNYNGNKKRKKYQETKLMFCNCKSRNCQTKYCICKKRNIKCTDKCNCCNCWNTEFDTNIKLTKFYKKQKKTKRKQANATSTNLHIIANKPKIVVNEQKIAVPESKIAVPESKIIVNEPKITVPESKIINISNTFDNLSDKYLLDKLLLNKYLNEIDFNLKLHDINLSFIENKNEQNYNFLSDPSLPSIDIAEELLNINLF